MIFLPIVERELRVAARRPATHWWRFCIALVVVAAWGALAMGSGRYMRAQDLGQHVFIAIGIPGFAYCLLAGGFLTADCLSSEKREGTLGLLFLTDLKSYDVVFGKLAATSLHAFYGVLAILPVLALPLLMGGVTGAEYGRMTLVLMATLFVSLTLGLVVSVYSYETHRALTVTLGLITVQAGILPALFWLQKIFFDFFDEALFGPLFMVPSPGYTFTMALERFYRTPVGREQFWMSLAVIFFLGLLFLTLACQGLQQQWREKNRHSPHGGKIAAPRSAAIPVLVPRRTLWDMRRLNANPFLWLTNRDQRTARWAFWIIGAGSVLWLLFFIGSYASDEREASFIISFCLAFGMHQIFKCLFTIEACRRFCEDRASGAMELLLATPLNPRDILNGQRQVLKRHFSGLRIVLVIIAAGFLALVILPNRVHISGRESVIFAMIFAGGGLMLYLDSYALGWQGMLLGLSGRKTHRAVLLALGRVMLPMWAPLFMWIMMGTAGMLNDEETVFVNVVLWLAAGIALDLVAGTYARRKVQNQFRRLVAETELSRHGRATETGVGKVSPASC